MYEAGTWVFLTLDPALYSLHNATAQRDVVEIKNEGFGNGVDMYNEGE